MQAVDSLLDAYPEWRGKFVLIQAAAPTRSKLPSYGKLQEDAMALAEEIMISSASAMASSCSLP